MQRCRDKGAVLIMRFSRGDCAGAEQVQRGRLRCRMVQRCRCRSAEVWCRGDFADSIVQLLIAEHVQRFRGAEVAQSEQVVSWSSMWLHRNSFEVKE